MKNQTYSTNRYIIYHTELDVAFKGFIDDNGILLDNDFLQLNYFSFEYLKEQVLSRIQSREKYKFYVDVFRQKEFKDVDVSKFEIRKFKLHHRYCFQKGK